MEYRLTFQQYQQGLREGKYLGLKCSDCGHTTFPPQGVCRNCGGYTLDVQEINGSGELRTFTVIRVAPEGMKPPYIVGMVELDEGPWVMGRVTGIDPDEADMDLIDRKVKLGSEAFEKGNRSEEGSFILTFAPV